MIVGDRIQSPIGNCFSKKNQERHDNMTKYNDKKDNLIPNNSTQRYTPLCNIKKDGDVVKIVFCKFFIILAKA